MKLEFKKSLIVLDQMVLFIYSNIKKLLKNKNFFKGKIKGLEMPAKRSIDIDTIEDLKLARYFFKKKI